MSPSNQDDDGGRRATRPRANTSFAANSFGSFAPWRKQKQEIATPYLTTTTHPMPLEELIEALTPPVVPSVQHAKSLANVLSSASPLPQPIVINRILAHLCAKDAPASIQAAGFDVLSTYLENSEAPQLTPSDRLTYFTYFLDPELAWAHELWEARFKALRTLTNWGKEMSGLEAGALEVLRTWIRGAFVGLLGLGFSPLERAETTERERSIGILSLFMTAAFDSVDVASRLPEREKAKMLTFFENLVEVALDNSSLDGMPDVPSVSPAVEITNPMSPTRPSHRRHPSSTSVDSVLPAKTPADTAVHLYLEYLKSQAKTLSWEHLKNILAILFRVLAYFPSRLPRLTVATVHRKGRSTEDKVVAVLSDLFSGHYSATCFNYLRQLLQPPSSAPADIDVCMQVAIGAARTLRNEIRMILKTRLARAYIQRESSLGYSPSGAPSHLDVEREVMERAWPKDETAATSGWISNRLRRMMQQCVEAWAHYSLDTGTVERRAKKERIFDDVAGVLKDVLQEFDSREEPEGSLEEDEAEVVGATLRNLCTYVYTLNNADGTPLQLPLNEPQSASSPFLRTLSHLLSRDYTTFMTPPLSSTLLLLADHLTDMDTSRLPSNMLRQRLLSPSSLDWLDHWGSLLANPVICGPLRPLTRKAVMVALKDTYDSIKDMPVYRRPLSNLVMEFCQRQLKDITSAVEDYDLIWIVLGQEVVLSSVDAAKSDNDDDTVDRYIGLFLQMIQGHSDPEEEEDDPFLTGMAEMTLPSAGSTSTSYPNIASPPVLSRVQTEVQGQGNPSALPSVMSLLSSLSGNPPGSTTPGSSLHEARTTPSPLPAGSCKISVGPINALITVFCQLAFTPLAQFETSIRLVMRVYMILVDLLNTTTSPRVRLAILKFVMHLRADRDHHVYYAHTGFDMDDHVRTLAALVNHAQSTSTSPPEPSERSRRTEQRPSRARTINSRSGGRPSNQSRSRSRAPRLMASTGRRRPTEPLWYIPDVISFTPPESETPSVSLVSYNPEGPADAVLQISEYLDAIVGILQKEANWEVLSYVLCHLPAQLANKHLFCGPLCRSAIVKIMSTMCGAIVQSDSVDAETDGWARGIPNRDASGLAYHTLSVMVSYKRCFDKQQRHMLVDIFQRGLDGQHSTIKCCLHALTLSAFDLELSMTKYLSQILEKLSQIMSIPEMAVHILGFIGVVGSRPSLYSNFTDDDYKMVFGVALQYLQHHNRMGGSPTIPWALSQYVRVISYYIVYIWFLAIKLPDRPRHVNYIVRQVLIANEGKEQVDESSEVCFDWLARYTYASADPRPASSVLGDILMKPSVPGAARAIPTSEKTWVLGSSVVTIRSLPKLGWVEVMSRRPSGYTKFLCRVENLPLVGPGDVNPDLVSTVASLIMDRSPGHVDSLDEEDESKQGEEYKTLIVGEEGDEDDEKPTDPDSVTGYVWSKTAPSQRRKDVAVDPSFFALQLSSYPERLSSRQPQMLVNPDKVPAFIRSLDRTPVIDTHKVGVMYVAPGQTDESEILRNTHGSPAYTRFLEGLGRLINLRDQVDVYAGGLDPDEDGEYAYAWWDDTGQVLYHTATMMPTLPDDPQCTNKKRHLGNDFVKIVWNDSGTPYRFETLSTQFQFINIVIEPHSFGAIAAFSDNLHENEYFKVIVQRAPGMSEFTPIGNFKLISAKSLPLLVRQLALLADWYASIFQHTQGDTEQVEFTTNWQHRLRAIKRFKTQQMDAARARAPGPGEGSGDAMEQEVYRDFSASF